MVQKLTKNEIQDMPGANLRRILQDLRLKAAGSGDATDPVVRLNIEDIKQELERREKLQNDVNSWHA